MQLRETTKNSFTLIEILADNGNPASAANPVASNEYAEVDFPELSGKLAVISGMPMSAVCLVALRYKNVFGAIAIANPREGVAEVAHSVNPDYKVGFKIPLD